MEGGGEEEEKGKRGEEGRNGGREWGEKGREKGEDEGGAEKKRSG